MGTKVLFLNIVTRIHFMYSCPFKTLMLSSILFVTRSLNRTLKDKIFIYKTAISTCIESLGRLKLVEHSAEIAQELKSRRKSYLKNVKKNHRRLCFLVVVWKMFIRKQNICQFSKEMKLRAPVGNQIRKK